MIIEGNFPAAVSASISALPRLFTYIVRHLKHPLSYRFFCYCYGNIQARQGLRPRRRRWQNAAEQDSEFCQTIDEYGERIQFLIECFYMKSPRQETKWSDKLLPLLRLISPDSLAPMFQNAFDIWEILNQFQDRIGYHGMYEILDYNSKLEIMDPEGKTAILTRHEVIRFLQDNVVAIHDHAWGDGDIFAEYNCQPGIPVDFYEDGSKWNVLISLRETKNRGDVIDLWVERTIKDGLLEKEEWLETEVDHRTDRMKLSVIFPQERRCQRATLSRRTISETIALDEQHFLFLEDGRQKLTWQTSRPKLHDRYTIKWRW